ncbi:MAG: hypothetical protein K0Q89_2403, partial [Thermomicrobiales bacterium]|nr:hypothetical protein [Thermomicrobiales bacterium]
MSNIPAEPRLSYEARLDSASAGYERVDARWNLVANARLIAFLAAVTAAAWGLWGRAAVGWALAGLLLGVFVLLAIYHARLGRQRARLATLRAIQEEGLARLHRRWADLPMSWVPEVLPDHPYAVDLDIVGRASLFQLLDTTATRMGRECLAAWLLTPADPVVATTRQGAVAELAPLLDLRQEIELRGRAASGAETDPEPFLAWAEDPHGLGDRAWLRWVAWLGPIAVIALGIADLSGVIAAPLWGVPLLVNLLVGATAARRVYATIAEVVTEQRAITAYAGQLEVLATADFTDPALRHLQERLGTGQRGAPAMLCRLGRLTGMAIPPSSVLYVPIQALTLWDVHVLF